VRSKAKLPQLQRALRARRQPRPAMAAWLYAFQAKPRAGFIWPSSRSRSSQARG
jgi:hypothetical protein